MWRVTVAANSPWEKVTVGGRHFSERPVLLPDAAMTAEIEHSPLLDVVCLVPNVSDPEPEATTRAAELMQEHGIDPATVVGTGTDGRITARDVQEVIGSGN